MKRPKASKDFEIPGLPNFTDRFIYVYKLIKNLYGLKDARNMWYDYLKSNQIKFIWLQ